MEIRINGEKADIIIENEKTIGDLLSGLDNWLAASQKEKTNFRLSGLAVDGAKIDTQSLDTAFIRGLDGIKTLDIEISSLHELLYTALLETKEAVSAREKLEYEARGKFTRDWEAGPAAALIRAQYPDLFYGIMQAFSGEGPGTQVLAAIIDERLRELLNPQAELAKMKQLIADTALRMENLPLNLQTGKDREASDTVQVFIGITEKIYRILDILKDCGFPFADSNLLNEFNAALKEMLAAYEQKDSVLVGDMAEYEMAPRLRALYEAINNPAGKTAVKGEI